VKYTAAALLLLLLAGCTAAPAPVADPSPEATAPEADVWTGFDYQLGGGYTPPAGANVVARDRTDVPADGIDTICYVNGFQTQGEDAELWAGHPELLLTGPDGDPVIDPNWPDEFLLDTSTPEKRSGIADIIGGWIDGCALDGFVAVEFDNLDSFTRSDGALTQDDNVALAEILVSRAHENFLRAGQKNSAELSGLAPEIGFDFAVTEECHRWDECGVYVDAYGEDLVLNIEYTDDLRGTAEEVCADPSIPAMTIIRDRDLTTPDNPDYFFEAC
jgi:hypothetical protein